MSGSTLVLVVRGVSRESNQPLDKFSVASRSDRRCSSAGRVVLARPPVRAVRIIGYVRLPPGTPTEATTNGSLSFSTGSASAASGNDITTRVRAGRVNAFPLPATRADLRREVRAVASSRHSRDSVWSTTKTEGVRLTRPQVLLVAARVSRGSRFTSRVGTGGDELSGKLVLDRSNGDDLYL